MNGQTTAPTATQASAAGAGGPGKAVGGGGCGAGGASGGAVGAGGVGVGGAAAGNFHSIQVMLGLPSDLMLSPSLPPTHRDYQDGLPPPTALNTPVSHAAHTTNTPTPTQASHYNTQAPHALTNLNTQNTHTPVQNNHAHVQGSHGQAQAAHAHAGGSLEAPLPGPVVGEKRKLDEGASYPGQQAPTPPSQPQQQPNSTGKLTS